MDSAVYAVYLFHLKRHAAEMGEPGMVEFLPT
jgi:hypothetical protein